MTKLFTSVFNFFHRPKKNEREERIIGPIINLEKESSISHITTISEKLNTEVPSICSGITRDPLIQDDIKV